MRSTSVTSEGGTSRGGFYAASKSSASKTTSASSEVDKNKVVWPRDHAGLRMSLTRFASVLPDGGEEDVGLTEFTSSASLDECMFLQQKKNFYRYSLGLQQL